MIRGRFTYGRQIPWRTSKRGRDITGGLRAMPAPEWVMEQWPGSATNVAVRGHGIREGKRTDETLYNVSSLRTGAKAMLRAVRQRWSIENSWHWMRDVPLREDTHSYRENNGVQILATLRSLAINALRLDGLWSITEGTPPWLTTSRGCSDCWAGCQRRRRLRMTSNRNWVAPLGPAGSRRVLDHLAPERILPLQLASDERAIAQARQRR